jgi:hypothetical protein
MADFEKLKDYYLINGGAHLKPPARIAPPALTNHIALWMPSEQSGDLAGELQGRTRRECWLRNVDRYLANFVRASGGSGANESIQLFRHSFAGLSTSAAGPQLTPLSAHEVSQHRQEQFAFNFSFHGIPMKMRAVAHSEFVTLTLVAELRPPNVDSECDEVCAKLRECFGILADKIPSRLDELLRGGRFYAPRPSESAGIKSQETMNKLGSSPEYLYCGFWDAFWSEYRACLTTSLKGDIGVVFGDFRGLILSGDFGPEDNVYAWTLDKPFVEGTTPDRVVHFAKMSDEHSLALADSLRLVLEAAERSEAENPETAIAPSPLPAAMEHSAAYFLDHRVLYLSSLSARRPAKLFDGDRMGDRMSYQPLRYLIFGPRNRWQMGRLIERIHALDTYRLASLVELTNLNAANDRLKVFEKRMRSAITSGELHDAQKELSDIEASCSGGVDYRIERAQRYISGFRSMAAQLRVRRVEGYQPYDEFVQRRIGSFWAFISRLGNRIERARSRLDSLNVKTQTLEQQKQTEEQTKLLRFAEIAAIIPIGYYGTHLMVSFANMIGGFDQIRLSPGGLITPVGARDGLFAILAMFFYAGILRVLRLWPGEFSERLIRRGRK